MTQIIQTGTSYSPLAQALSGLFSGATNILKMKEQSKADPWSGVLAQMLGSQTPQATLPFGFRWPGGVENNPNTQMSVPDFISFLQGFQW